MKHAIGSTWRIALVALGIFFLSACGGGGGGGSASTATSIGVWDSANWDNATWGP